ncbi:hypothetical protein P9112_000993 [Eukaryota sp. TZLM1-RC]
MSDTDNISPDTSEPTNVTPSDLTELELLPNQIGPTSDADPTTTFTSSSSKKNVPDMKQRITQLENSLSLAKEHITKLRNKVQKEKRHSSALKELLNDQEALVRDATSKSNRPDPLLLKRSKSQKENLSYGRKRALKEIEELRKAMVDDGELSIPIDNVDKVSIRSKVTSFLTFLSSLFPFLSSDVYSVEKSHGTTCAFHFQFSRFVFSCFLICSLLSLPMLVSVISGGKFAPFIGPYPVFFKLSELNSSLEFLYLLFIYGTMILLIIFSGFFVLNSGLLYYKVMAKSASTSSDSYTFASIVFGWNWNIAGTEPTSVQQNLMTESLLVNLNEESARQQKLGEVYRGWSLKVKRLIALVVLIGYTVVTAATILLVILYADVVRQFVIEIWSGALSFLGNVIVSLILAFLNLLSPRIISFTLYLESNPNPAEVNQKRIKRLFLFRFFNICNIGYAYLSVLNSRYSDSQFDCGLDFVGNQLTNLILTVFIVEKLSPLFIAIVRSSIKRWSKKEQNKDQKQEKTQEFVVADAGLRVLYQYALCCLVLPYSPFTSVIAVILAFLTTKWDRLYLNVFLKRPKDHFRTESIGFIFSLLFSLVTGLLVANIIYFSFFLNHNCGPFEAISPFSEFKNHLKGSSIGEFIISFGLNPLLLFVISICLLFVSFLGFLSMNIFNKELLNKTNSSNMTIDSLRHVIKVKNSIISRTNN